MKLDYKLICVVLLLLMATGMWLLHLNTAIWYAPLLINPLIGLICLFMLKKNASTTITIVCLGFVTGMLVGLSSSSIDLLPQLYEINASSLQSSLTLATELTFIHILMIEISLIVIGKLYCIDKIYSETEVETKTVNNQLPPKAKLVSQKIVDECC